MTASLRAYYVDRARADGAFAVRMILAGKVPEASGAARWAAHEARLLAPRRLTAARKWRKA